MNEHLGTSAAPRGCDSIALWLLPSGHLLGNVVSKLAYSADALSICEMVELSRVLSVQRGGSEVALRRLLADLGLLDTEVLDQGDRRSSGLLCLRAGAQYWDYAHPNAFQRDRDDMAAYEMAGGERTCVPMGKVVPFGAIPSGARALREVAHHVVDAQYQENFHHELVHKTRVPSLGSRHGIACFLSYLDEDLQRRHCVQILPEGQDRVSSCPLIEEDDLPNFYLVLCARYERYQWRYRNSWIYQCVFLDLGHMLAAMQVYAAHRSLPLIFSEAADDAIRHSEFLVNEPLVICSVA